MGGISFFQPNPGPDEPCPICGSPRPASGRYPDHVCADCLRDAVDEGGRPVRFVDLGPGAGFGAEYADTGTPRESDLCFVRGVRCRAAEAYFGGVVVRPAPAP